MCWSVLEIRQKTNKAVKIRFVSIYVYVATLYNQKEAFLQQILVPNIILNNRMFNNNNSVETSQRICSNLCILMYVLDCTLFLNSPTPVQRMEHSSLQGFIKTRLIALTVASCLVLTFKTIFLEDQLGPTSLEISSLVFI